MNRIRKFIDNGILLTPSVYEEIKDMEEDSVKELLESDDLFLEDFSLDEDKGSKGDHISEEFESTLRVIKKAEKASGKYKISQFVDYYNNRFSRLKEILKKRVDSKNLISINKLSSYGLEGTIIGIVREITGDYVLVEDNTSSVKVDTNEKLIEDEVIGIRGKKGKEKFVADKIYYPDLSFKRNVNTLEEDQNALFISDLNSENIKKIRDVIGENNVKYLFIAGEIGLEDMNDLKETLNEIEGMWVSEERKNIDNGIDRLLVSNNPGWCEVSGEMTILQYLGHNFDEYEKKLGVDTSRDLTLKLLKKRHLDPLGKNYFDDPFLLDQLPDIIHCGNLNDFSVYNYKGTTVVNTTPEKCVLVNFGNREIEEVDI
ncbi:MAG: hypothetical protein ABEK36_05810 [Candidatus Aenigmatarchaeota archaeon]